MWYVVVYKLDRFYGGPEEGGWWYDIGHMIKEYKHQTEDGANAQATILRKEYPDNDNRFQFRRGEYDYRVEVSPYPGEDWPSYTPRYE